MSAWMVNEGACANRAMTTRGGKKCDDCGWLDHDPAIVLRGSVVDNLENATRSR